MRNTTHKHQRPAYFGIISRTLWAPRDMTLHADELNPGKSVIHEGTVLVSEFGTAHRAKNTGGNEISSHNNTVILFEPGPYYLGEAIPGSIETGLYRTEVGIRNLRYFLVRSAL